MGWLLAVTIGAQLILFTFTMVSAFAPRYRVWPPPSRQSWQFYAVSLHGSCLHLVFQPRSCMLQRLPDLPKDRSAHVVKLVYIIRRRSDFSPEDFYQRWLSHGPLVTEFAEAIKALRYVQSHTIDTPLNEQFAASRGMGKAYDGITEVWWDSIEDLVAGMNTPEGQAAHKRLLEDEREFIDLENSFISLTEEHPIFDRR